jgi:hypothetical protein
MPIYVYRNNLNGTKAEVLQKDERLAGVVREIDPDSCLNVEDGFFDDEYADVEREPTTPGGFQGLPTPKFHRSS